jgi:hypothetical protein
MSAMFFFFPYTEFCSVSVVLFFSFAPPFGKRGTIGSPKGVGSFGMIRGSRPELSTLLFLSKNMKIEHSVISYNLQPCTTTRALHLSMQSLTRLKVRLFLISNYLPHCTMPLSL